MGKRGEMKTITFDFKQNEYGFSLSARTKAEAKLLAEIASISHERIASFGPVTKDDSLTAVLFITSREGEKLRSSAVKAKEEEVKIMDEGMRQIVRVTRHIVIEGERWWVEITLANSLVTPLKPFQVYGGTVRELSRESGEIEHDG
jgi:hypothetical protein